MPKLSQEKISLAQKIEEESYVLKAKQRAVDIKKFSSFIKFYENKGTLSVFLIVEAFSYFREVYGTSSDFKPVMVDNEKLLLL